MTMTVIMMVMMKVMKLSRPYSSATNDISCGYTIDHFVVLLPY